MGELASFHEVRFPIAVSFGARGGPERKNEIVRLTSGRERRNLRLAQSRRRFDAGTGLRSLDDLYEVIAFFEARRGSLHGFRFRDPLDWQSCRPPDTPRPLDQAIGNGDGQTRRFQLTKLYGEGGDAYRRTISKPVEGSVTVARDTAPLGPDAFTVDVTTGTVELAAAPAPGVVVSAGFQFDVPVRFDTDAVEASVTGFKAGHIPSIPLVEVLLP